MPKPTSAAEPPPIRATPVRATPVRATPVRATPVRATPVRVVIVTLDSHLASAVERAYPRLKRAIPGLSLSLHAAAEWGNDPALLEHCHQAIAQGDIIIATMLFMEDHIQAVLPALQARRDHCDAMIGCMSAAEIIRLTRLGDFRMDGEQRGLLALLKRLRGNTHKTSTPGEQQVAMLRRIPRILRFIPGKAQDVRAYFLTLQYWLAGSDDNIVNLVRFLVDRYADGERHALRGSCKPAPPIEYPQVGLYHPRLPERFSERLAALDGVAVEKNASNTGRVGLLLMRSYVLAGNCAHYDGVIAALEARGINVVPAFASGLDARPAIEKYFLKNGQAQVDAVVSLTGFSLVGGPAYNDSNAAQDILSKLDVPYLAAHAIEFQPLEQWQNSERGLLPVEATMMVAIPELDGATVPMLFGGRANNTAQQTGRSRDMQSHPERAAALAARVDKLITLRHTPRAQRRIAIVLFNFPPNSGATGSAAHLSVFASLQNTLEKLAAEGYTVDIPDSEDELCQRITQGNAERFGTDANVCARIPANDHVRREPWLAEIEAQWGPAPGRQLSDGHSLFILGAQFGNVFVGVQPAFGYEGDPMRLLFEKSFTPTHAFAAFYRHMREDFGAHACLHFGTHGALEFMPGKQTGLSADCWPDRLIGDLPNLYLYAANNPSEGTIAKRRGGATLISYLTPPLAQAGLYRELLDLKAALERWRGLPPEAQDERRELLALIQTQAEVLELTAPASNTDPAVTEQSLTRLHEAILELEYALIPQGLHVVGEAPSTEQRIEMLTALADATYGEKPPHTAIEALVQGHAPETALAQLGTQRHHPPQGNDQLLKRLQDLAATNQLLAANHELDALIHALDGGFIRPAPGGDLLRSPDILPTGRNLHGFDPYRIPSRFALLDGTRQAARLLERHHAEGNLFPESVALVLWGTDNLKSEGCPIAQALALMGAMPRFDGYGRLAGADLISLEELERPRIDVVMTLSGIFRDLLPLQTKLLAEAAYLAASADEPLDQNFIRKHAMQYQQAHDCDLETAALRVFSNADGAYGSNVNHLIDNGCWNDEDELAETYTRRKSFAYGRSGSPTPQAELLKSMLADVQLTYQNLDSVELGVTTVDHYFDTLGGISRSVARARGDAVPVYISDQTQGEGAVRTLAEQVALETRTRMLNPKWYESMLKHGYEGVRHIEAHITNTMGWSATTGQVAPWVYQQLTQTFVLDKDMRERLAKLNPTASAKVANRLLEAHERNYWDPDDAVLDALRRAGEELEDRLEGINVEVAA